MVEQHLEKTSTKLQAPSCAEALSSDIWCDMKQWRGPVQAAKQSSFGAQNTQLDWLPKYREQSPDDRTHAAKPPKDDGFYHPSWGVISTESSNKRPDKK